MGKTSKLDARASQVLVMREMGWTYFEYLDTPLSFIADVIDVLSAEAEAKNSQNQHHNENTQTTVSDLPPGDTGPVVPRRR